jgi:carboxylesterase
MLPLRAVPTDPADPAADRAAALARYAALVAADEAVPDATRSRLFEPDGPATATIVLWHGFTNAPSQFVAVGEQLRDAGFRVLLPRMPYHGLPDVMNRELARLTAQELVAQVQACTDIAAGFGDPVWVIGLSAGATLAAWAAATRTEVTRLVLAAPLVAPVGAPMPLIRLLVRFPRIVPRFYWWWDPRVKERIVGSPYAYPGFPVPAIMPYLYLSEALFDHSMPVGHTLERVVLISNPGDFAIRKDAAKDFGLRVFAPHAAYAGEACIDGELKWMHDFVEPRSAGTGSTEQVVAVLLAAFGVTEPTAGGVLVPPLVEPQPPSAAGAGVSGSPSSRA